MKQVLKLTKEELQTLLGGTPVDSNSVTVELQKPKWSVKSSTVFVFDRYGVHRIGTPTKGMYDVRAIDCRETYDEALLLKKQVDDYQTLLNFVYHNDIDEQGNRWVADWDNELQKKYYVLFNSSRAENRTWSNNYQYTAGKLTTYMSKECADKLATVLNSRELKLTLS